MCRDLVTALRSFARHQAESQPDDAPYEPGGVLSIPDSSFWFTAGHAGGLELRLGNFRACCRP